MSTQVADRTVQPAAPRTRAAVPAYAWALGGVTLLAAALRFSTLGVQSFWHDEAVTVGRIIHPSLFTTIKAIPSSEATPPLYYVLAWGWTKVFGLGEVGIRSLSALLGTAVVPVTYFAAARVASRRAALIAAGLVCCSPMLVWYSQEARAYELLALLGALSLLFFLEALDEPRARPLALWAVTSALALTTHYFAVFLVAVEAAWLLWRVRSRAVWLAVALPTLVGGALVPLVLHQKGRGHDEWIGRIAFSTRVKDSVRAFLVGPSGAPTAALYALAALAIAVGVGLLVRVPVRERARLLPPLAVGAAVAVLPVLAIVVGADYLYYRNLIPAVVPIAIVLAAGFATRRMGIAAAVVLCACGIASVLAVDVDRDLQRANWRDAAKAVGPAPATRALVVPFIGDDPMEVYLGHTTRLKGSATVSEVDVLGWSANGTARSKPPAPGFRVVARRHVGKFTLLRFRSPAPRTLGRVELAHAKIGSEHGAVLLQEATP